MILNEITRQNAIKTLLQNRCFLKIDFRGREESISIGRAEGEAKNLIENVKMLITNTQKPLAEVLSMLGITQEKYDQSLALLNQ